MNIKIFPFILIFLDICAATVYIYHKDYRRGVYWRRILDQRGSLNGECNGMKEKYKKFPSCSEIIRVAYDDTSKKVFRLCPVCRKKNYHWMGKWETCNKENNQYMQCQNCWSIINYTELDKRLKKKERNLKRN